MAGCRLSRYAPPGDARVGTGLPEYYRRRGWREAARLPRAIRVSPGDERDEVWFHRPVRPG
jgi:hypothetical protein